MLAGRIHMKRIVSFLVALIMMLTVSCSCYAAVTYTLPEKMHNQLAIGSGLKGSITVLAEGPLSKEPFWNAVADAEYSIRGIASGKDQHYHLFQADENGNQTSLIEIYRKDGVHYLRSDMVAGKILALPGWDKVLDQAFPVKGENPTLSSFLINLLTMQETDSQRLEAVLTRFQNELELWLGDFTVNAESTRREDGTSAFEFSYVIPLEQFREQAVRMTEDLASDPEMISILGGLMGQEEITLYANSSLGKYYLEALQSLNLNGDIRMSKLVSTMGDVISSQLSLPLDPATTGYQSLLVENRDELTLFRAESTEKSVILVIPALDTFRKPEFSVSVWYASAVKDSGTQAGESTDLSVRIDLQKTSSEYNDEEERSHLQDHYNVSIQQDTTYFPDADRKDALPAFEAIQADLDLHYYSKYSQNSATTLEIGASYQRGESSVSLSGKLKTAAPWLFMPFEVVNPVNVEADHPETIVSYLTDWISNASYMVHHTLPAEEATPASSEAPATEVPSADTGEPTPDANETPVPSDADPE